jgi:DNA modification methylase
VRTDVERVLAGQLADMTFCDPPYNVDYANSPKDKLRGKHRPILNDSLGSGFEAFLHDACVNILSVTKGAVYVCMSSSELDTLQRAFRAAGGKWSTFVIWATISVSTSRSYTAGRRGATTTGAVPETRATSGSSTSRYGTTCTRP